MCVFLLTDSVWGVISGVWWIIACAFLLVNAAGSWTEVIRTPPFRADISQRNVFKKYASGYSSDKRSTFYYIYSVYFQSFENRLITNMQCYFYIFIRHAAICNALSSTNPQCSSFFFFLRFVGLQNIIYANTKKNIPLNSVEFNFSCRIIQYMPLLML